MLPLDTRIIDLTVADLIQILDDRYSNTTPQLPGTQRADESEKMDVDACAQLTGYVPDYIRQLVFKKLIPFYKTRRKLHFKRSEIITWMYKRKTTPVEELADQHIANHIINHKNL